MMAKNTNVLYMDDYYYFFIYKKTPLILNTFKLTFDEEFGPIILKLLVCFGNRSSISTPHRKVLPLLEEISQKKMRQNLASNLRIFLPPRDPPTRLCFHHCWNVWNWKLPKVCEECFLMILSPSNCVAYIRITRKTVMAAVVVCVFRAEHFSQTTLFGTELRSSRPLKFHEMGGVRFSSRTFQSNLVILI